VSGTNEWGIPDWTKAEEYSNQHKAGIRGWAWEFLRRWPEYRNFWTEKVKPYTDADGFIHRDADGNFWPHLDKLISRFGVELPSPPYDSTPAIFASAYTSYVPNDGRELQRLQLKEHEIAIIIDLARPLPTQFKRARKSAEEQQKTLRLEGRIDLKRARSRAPGYVTYLRLLDGEEAGASSTEIADLLFPKVPNDYPDNKRFKVFYDSREAAQKLRDGGYRALLEMR
jgi:hypothetical protein